MTPRRLVLISGWGYPPAAWEDTVRRLSPDWELSVLDSTELLSGSAASPAGPDIAKRIRNRLAPLAPCTFGGWSLGGMLALEHVSSLESLIDGLLLLATTPLFCVDQGFFPGAAPAELHAMRTGLRRRRRETLLAFYARAARPEAPDPERMHGLDDADRECDFERGLSYLEKTDLREAPCPSGLPIAILHGGADEVIVPEAGVALADQLAPCHLDILPGAGHDFPLRDPLALRRGLSRLSGL